MSLSSIQDLASTLASNEEGITIHLRSEEKALLKYINAKYESDPREEREKVDLKNRREWGMAHEKSLESLRSLSLLSSDPSKSTTAMENAPRFLGTLQSLSARIGTLRRKGNDFSQEHVTGLQELWSKYLEQSNRILRKIPDPTSSGEASSEGSSEGSSEYTLAPEVISGEPEPEVASEEPTVQEMVQEESTVSREEDVDGSSQPTAALDLQQLAELLSQSQSDLQTARKRFEAYRDAPLGEEQAFKSAMEDANKQWLSSRKTFLEALSTRTGMDHTELHLGSAQQGFEQMLTEAEERTSGLQQELSSLAGSSTRSEGQSLNDDVITRYVEASSVLADLMDPKAYEPQVPQHDYSF